MRFNFGTDILNFEGEKVGELNHVVIDPSTDRVTALIAKKGLLFPNDKVIPMSLVMETNEDHIKLYDFEGSYEDLDDYVDVHYVSAEKNRKNTFMDEEGKPQPPLIAYPPAGRAGFGYVPVIANPIYEEQKKVEVKNIPEDSAEIVEGGTVLDMEGEPIGNVEQIIADSQSDQVTHLVISKGLFFNEEKMIPSSWVSGYDSNQLKLVVNSKIIEQLPEYEA